ncbi:MAG: hypothetical protein KDA44_17325, partial [Planctomycetales bacterium]|nr:hypothetical protein [Planctomycetales bacterium]
MLRFAQTHWPAQAAVALVLFALSLPFASATQAADLTSTWIVGGPLNWSDPANWDTADAPNNGASTFDAAINAGNAVVDAPVVVDGLSLTGNAFLSGPESVTVLNSALWEGREIGNAGGVTISAGATLAITGAADRRLNNGSVLSIAGVATVAGNGNIDSFATTPGNSVTIDIAATGSFDLQSNADISDGASDSSAFVRYGTLSNAGVFKKTAGGESRIAADWTVNNSGTIAAESGTLRFSGAANGFNNHGAATVAAGATLSVGGGVSTGTWTTAAGGNLAFEPTSVNTQVLSGAIANDGSLAIKGRVNFAAGAMYSGAGAFELQSGGRLLGVAPLALTNAMWSGGRIDHTGGLTVAATGAAPQLTISGAAGKQLGNDAHLIIDGTAVVTSTANIDAVALPANPATVAINAGGTLELASNASLSDGFSGANPNPTAATLAIDGTLRKSAGGGATNIHDNWTVVNNGVIEVANGSLRIYGDVQHNGIVDLAGGDIRFEGAVTGSGSFTGAGAVAMTGSYDPGSSPAAVTMAGDLSLAATNALTIEIGGTTAGSQYDQLDVGGAAAIGGALTVNFIDLGGGTFAPSVGDEFEIIAAGALSGTFASLTLPALPTGAWEPVYDADGFSLRVSTYSADFDRDGDVDGNDLANWQAGFGTLAGAVKADGDENNNGAVNGADFLAWQR